jgi:hypothetical protein
MDRGHQNTRNPQPLKLVNKDIKSLGGGSTPASHDQSSLSHVSSERDSVGPAGYRMLAKGSVDNRLCAEHDARGTLVEQALNGVFISDSTANLHVARKTLNDLLRCACIAAAAARRIEVNNVQRREPERLPLVNDG